ncbi:protein maelstrom 1 [Lucilia sericata]|uniref:protein maelstrom 1 n=1 Tax=Lucilia sericata TaxID=13632 RepID=UPI0018A821F9|nr:protein maelstrom 1 [Lucilia sericata]XP_037819035.1 protein maelstrom 1 [Lucilia sericata]XP_037819036.1 protein maelstrom 1 [Lucilia sericata]
MPPKKKTVANGFMNFTFEWKSKYGRNLTLTEATQEAGKVWATMPPEERAAYKEKAKEQKIILKSSKNVEKLTCTGTPVAFMEREKQDLENKERQMKRDIESTVSRSVKNDELELKSYYFIMVNYFTKTLKGGVYVPAELSVCEYSLKDGVKRMYQTLINPGVNIYGHQYEAQHHSDTTHNLPLPPNALGEKNLGSIYNDILNFIRDEETNDYPPLYTHRDGIHIVESVLEFLKADVGANNIDLKIYPIQYLFFIMKEATCEVGELEKPKSFYITDAFFERDFFEYQIGIACQYHEEIDKSKYCTQSYVTRWGYMFSDYMCRDIAIPLIQGRHCPQNTNLHAIITPAPSTCPDNTSYISMGTTSSYATKAVAGSKIYYEDQKSAISDGENKNYVNNFPALGGARKKVPNASSSVTPKHFKKCSATDVVVEDDCKNLNPWTSRSRNVPREPDTTHFTIDYTRDESDFDDFNSVASFGRGRGSYISTTLNSSNTTTASGRGRFIRQ